MPLTGPRVQCGTRLKASSIVVLGDPEIPPVKHYRPLTLLCGLLGSGLVA